MPPNSLAHIVLFSEIAGYLRKAGSRSEESQDNRGVTSGEIKRPPFADDIIWCPALQVTKAVEFTSWDSGMKRNKWFATPSRK